MAACPSLSPFTMLLYLIVFVIMIAGMWKVFTKARQPGWACLIPIYNILIILKMVNKPWWWILLYLIPIVSIVVSCMVMHELSKAFGKGIGFTVGLIFLPFIFFPILGFGDATYRGSAPAGADPVAAN
jgi:uncharacterized membrane protein YoaK (UPF0700 family)